MVADRVVIESAGKVRGLSGTVGSAVFDILNYAFLGLLGVLAVFPFLEIIQISLSDPAHVTPDLRYHLSTWAQTASLDIYEFILGWSKTLIGLGNSVKYAFFGIAISLTLNTLVAYPLSKKRLHFRGPVVVFVAFTMFFSGGLIPTYLLVRALGMLDTMWALVLPTAFSAWHMIMMRTFFEQVPAEMEDAAHMDGANDVFVLARIYVPLSKALYAAMALYFFVITWNSRFHALVYLQDIAKYPIQLVMRNFILEGHRAHEITNLPFYKGYYLDDPAVQKILNAALMVVTIIPIIAIYPFAQKYLIKGTMIGAIKG